MLLNVILNIKESQKKTLFYLFRYFIVFHQKYI